MIIDGDWIDEVTIGEAREIARRLGFDTVPPPEHPYVGRYVVVRTNPTGVHVGVLAQAAAGEALLTESRRILYWSDPPSVSEISVSGITREVSCTVAQIALFGVMEIIPATEEAERRLRSFSVGQPYLSTEVLLRADSLTVTPRSCGDKG